MQKERKHYKAIRQVARGLKVDDPTWQNAKELAQAKGCSISELVRTLITTEYNKFIRQQKSKQDFKQAKVVNQ